MARGVLRGALLLAVACVFACAAAPNHALPTRPGLPAPLPAHTSAPVAMPTSAIAGVRLQGVEYVPAVAVARRFGLAATEHDGGHAVTLEGPGTRAELLADTRSVTVNGLRVFLGSPGYFWRGELYIGRIDFDRCLAPLLRPGYGVAPLAPPRVIAIDAGHGGRDFGKINDQLRINEKTFTLDTAMRLKRLLEADGYRVVLTRDSDRFVELAKRSEIANAAGADLFLSIHFNALPTDRRTSGVEVYSFAPQFQRSTESWMPGQKDDSQATPEPANAFDYWNALLGQSVHRPFVTELKAPDRGKKVMHLGVLRGLRCPGVLVECGFLTSDTEARRIATPAYREQLAVALRDGIRDYARLLASLRRPPSS